MLVRFLAIRSKSLSGVPENNEAGPTQQADAKRCAQPAAPGDVLLDGHYGTEHKHPADAAGTDNEHQQHDGPATADAKNSVVDAQQEALPIGSASPPMLVSQAERPPAIRH